MELQLLNRSLALTSPPAFQQWHIRSQIDSICANRNIQFDGSGVSSKNASGIEAQVWAHRAGVNALAIDRFEGRLYVPPGALYATYRSLSLALVYSPAVLMPLFIYGT